MVGYTKLFSSITDSTVWREPDRTRLVWITMLAMSDADGYVAASVPGLADRARVPLDDCLTALAAFQEPDEWSRSKEFDGRRIMEVDGGWQLLNHGKYRAIQDAEHRREQSRLAMKRLRAARKEASEPAPADPVINVKTVSKVNPVNTGEQQLTHTEADTDTEARGKEKKPRASRSTALAMKCPEGVAEQIWADFLALRKAKRAPVTETVISNAIDEAALAQMPLEQFLRIWCARGSQGLQASWLKPNERQASGHVNRQAALEASNRAVGREWVAKMTAEYGDGGQHGAE